MKDINSTKKKDPTVLRSLQYFEAVTRHRSFKLAAADLGVTESAVSHQMRRFSDTIGQQLLVKSGRGIALTATGEALAAKLTSAFAGLESLVKDLVGEGQPALRLAVCSTSGPGWLIERLEDFYDAHPEIDLQLRLYAQDPTLTNEVADAFVTAYPVKADYAAIHLRNEMLVAVQAPRAKSRRKQLLRDRLITTELQSGRIGKDWIDFCRKTGIKLADLQDGPFRQCTHYLLALEMAKLGQGIALVPDFLAANDIRSGALVAFSDTLLPSKRAYYLCFRKTRAHEPSLVALAQWFKTEVSDSRGKPRAVIPKKRPSGPVRRTSAVTGTASKSV